MDVYPRSKTWPYLTVVLLLFLLALWDPNWWITGQANRLTWNRTTGDRLARDRAAPTGHLRLVRGRRGPTMARFVEPETVRLQPSVAQRVAIPPEPAFEDETESRATARFPRDSATGLTESALEVTARSQIPEQEIGPILPPRARHALDLTPADIDGLANSLPSDVMEQSPVLQSAADSAVTMVTTWPRAVSLWDRMGQLGAESAQVAEWVNDVQDTLNTLQRVPTLEDPEAAELLDRMKELADEATKMEAYLSPPNQRQIRRIGYGLQRRSDVWRQIHELARQQVATPRIVNVLEAISILNDVDQRLVDHPFAESWRNYLMLDELQRVATETWVADSTVRCELARKVLRRISALALTDEQRHTLKDPAVEHLKRQLEDWADASVDLLTLVTSLEQYEQIRSAAVAAQIAEPMQGLQFVRHSSADALYRALDMHYRNANIRFSVSSQLLNDLMPILEPEDRRIRDQILGANVSAQNRTWTDVHVKLIEDADQLRLRIEVDGRSRSRAVSSKGPVRMFTRDRSRFRAGKDLIVSDKGIFVTRAVASANGRVTLLDVRTDYDRVPLLGWIVRQIAMDEHNEQREQVRSRIQGDISRRVRKELDDSFHERLTEMEERLDRTVLKPLRELELDPKTVEMRTTPERLVMRYRLAAHSQLAAYTPRPRGVSGNVMSIQLHESLANNLLSQLQLEDQRIELEELMKRLSEKLKIQREDIHKQIPPNVILHLGNDRPIQFEFGDERILVTIRIKELKTRRRSWRNFVVRGRYRADVSQTHIDLHREGGIRLVSEQLGFRDQVALRGIFTKAMTRNHRLKILRGRFLSDDRLRNLGVTQFVARDGWIGLSIGPMDQNRIAAQPVADPR